MAATLLVGERAYVGLVCQTKAGLQSAAPRGSGVGASGPSQVAFPRRRCRTASVRAAVSVATEEGQKEPSPNTPPQDPAVVDQYLSLLKQAGQTRKVAKKEVLTALLELEKIKPGDPSEFLSILGGTASPGRTWMLVFNSSTEQQPGKGKDGKEKDGGGQYFPVTAVQRFDAEAMEVENAVYLGPLGYLAFTGPFGWTGRRLSFLYETLTLKIGPLGPFQFKVGKKEDAGRTPGAGKEGQKDPFFIFFHIDEEIAASRGRSGGVAFWVRCEKVTG